MICSFKLAISGTTDTEKKQQKQTPSPFIIEKNIDNFLQQKGNIQTNGTQVLPKLSSKVIEKFLLNVPLGSLSFIPVSGENSRDEFPHKMFNVTLKIDMQEVVRDSWEGFSTSAMKERKTL